MSNESISEILGMSGYAGYVWSAFGVTLLTLIVLFFTARAGLKKALLINEHIKKERSQ